MLKNCMLFAILWLITYPVWSAESWPIGLSFVGLQKDQWQLFLVAADADQPQVVKTVSEPRTPTYNAEANKIAYIDAAGNLREINRVTGYDRVVLKPTSKRAYTQPAYNQDGSQLFIVALKEGASVDTDIIAIQSNQSSVIVKQRSAQFEPYFYAPYTLYYSNVLCTVGCGKIIQEIWRINLITEDAEQLTLINAIVRHPVVSKDGKLLYISSNKAGNYNIWRFDLATGQFAQLTNGLVTDLSPALDHAGQLYFIRQSPSDVQLLRRRDDGSLHTLALPAGVEDLRDLEINQ